MPDWWTAWQFDNAVLTFGKWIDNKLAERDKDGKPVNTLRELLGIPLTDEERREMNRKSLAMFDSLFGGEKGKRSGIASFTVN